MRASTYRWLAGGWRLAWSVCAWSKVCERFLWRDAYQFWIHCCAWSLASSTISPVRRVPAAMTRVAVHVPVRADPLLDARMQGSRALRAMGTCAVKRVAVCSCVVRMCELLVVACRMHSAPWCAVYGASCFGVAKM